MCLCTFHRLLGRNRWGIKRYLSRRPRIHRKASPSTAAPSSHYRCRGLKRRSLRFAQTRKRLRSIRCSHLCGVLTARHYENFIWCDFLCLDAYLSFQLSKTYLLKKIVFSRAARDRKNESMIVWKNRISIISTCWICWKPETPRKYWLFWR